MCSAHPLFVFDFFFVCVFCVFLTCFLVFLLGVVCECFICVSFFCSVVFICYEVFCVLVIFDVVNVFIGLVYLFYVLCFINYSV